MTYFESACWEIHAIEALQPQDDQVLPSGSRFVIVHRKFPFCFIGAFIGVPPEFFTGSYLLPEL